MVPVDAAARCVAVDAPDRPRPVEAPDRAAWEIRGRPCCAPPHRIEEDPDHPVLRRTSRRRESEPAAGTEHTRALGDAARDARRHDTRCRGPRRTIRRQAAVRAARRSSSDGWRSEHARSSPARRRRRPLMLHARQPSRPATQAPCPRPGRVCRHRPRQPPSIGTHHPSGDDAEEPLVRGGFSSQLAPRRRRNRQRRRVASPTARASTSVPVDWVTLQTSRPPTSAGLSTSGRQCVR